MFSVFCFIYFSSVGCLFCTKKDEIIQASGLNSNISSKLSDIIISYLSKQSILNIQSVAIPEIKS